jgi:PAS domain S-box-containing protein
MVKKESNAEVERLQPRQRTFLRKVLDLDPNLIFAKDREGRFTLVNKAVADAYGTTVEDLLGKTDADFNPNKEEVEFFRKMDLEVMDSRQPRSIPEEKITEASGRERWLQTVKIPIIGDDGKADQVLGIASDITERKRVEEELRESERRLNRSQEIAHLGSWELDLLTKQLTWSDEVYRLFGLKPQEFAATYEAFLEAVHPDDRAAVDEAYSGSLRNGLDSYEIEHRVVRRSSGEIRWVHEKCFHIRNEASQISRSVGMVHDVTDRKLLEEEIKSIARFPDENPHPIMRFTHAGILMYSNKSCREMLSECIGDIGTTAPATWLKALREAVSLGSSCEMDFTCGKRMFSMLFVPVLHEEYVNVYGRDITERKLAAQALRDQTARLHAIVDTAVEGIIIIDDRGIMQTVNPAVQKIFDYAPEEMVGQNVNKLMPEPYHSQHEGYIGRYLRTGERRIIGIGREVQGRRKDGSVFPLDLSVAEIIIDGQRMFTGMLRDISQRKKAEEELKNAVEDLTRSNAELEQFAYVASHDLQKPLRMVSSYVKLLEKRYKDKLDSDADEFIGYAVDGAQRMQRLIEDLLSFSRVGTRGVFSRPLGLRKVLDQAIINLSMVIKETGAVITADSLPTVNGDDAQLIQLFQNLLGNSIRFRSIGTPEIHISASQQDQEWVITVKDNGIGIDPQYFNRIFLIFQRLHGKQKYPGTGIGLAICKKIIERHGGRIWVESEGSEGATFNFTLPVIQ